MFVSNETVETQVPHVRRVCNAGLLLLLQHACFLLWLAAAADTVLPNSGVFGEFHKSSTVTNFGKPLNFRGLNKDLCNDVIVHQSCHFADLETERQVDQAGDSWCSSAGRYHDIDFDANTKYFHAGIG